MWEAVVLAFESAIVCQGSTKLLLGSCVLLFFALYTTGSPPSSGDHWTAWQLPPGHNRLERLLPSFPSERPPQITVLDSHCGVCGQNLSTGIPTWESFCYFDDVTLIIIYHTYSLYIKLGLQIRIILIIVFWVTCLVENQLHEVTQQLNFPKSLLLYKRQSKTKRHLFFKERTNPHKWIPIY